MGRDKPIWLKKRASCCTLKNTDVQITEKCLHTVCQEAKCPNLVECYAQKTATFLLLGKSCTRACPFCDIGHSILPPPPDPEEPLRVAEAVGMLGLRHVVLTMVTRDDLPDGGAEHVAATVGLIHKHYPNTTIEALVSDFDGNKEALKCVIRSGISVFNHNLETVERLTPSVRHRATYRRSLEVLHTVYDLEPALIIKSGLMVGLGETQNEVHAALRDLYLSHVSIVTIGQYLQPSSKKLQVKAYIDPSLFQEYKSYGESIGLQSVFSGPFVRSSYHADQFLQKENYP